MISWQGASSGRLMFVVRKPSPLGIMCDTLVCGTTGILLNANLAEGKFIEPLKEYYQDYGAHTALCMRLVKPYVNSGRYLVGDARFGSYTCAYNLLNKMGIYSILNVKGNTKYSCKPLIKSQLLKRGDVASRVCTIPGGETVYMTGHMDKAPMVLAHTTGCTTEGEERVRHFKAYNSESGKYVSEKYTLRQPDVHAKYRS
jgi:hypothetical protein